MGMLLCAMHALGQPVGYYNAAAGLSGDALKAALHQTIKNHQAYPYSASSTDTWDILKESDRDLANSENVILVYSGNSVNGPQEFNNGNGWNREHVWPLSRGGFNTGSLPGRDLHHLKPCDIQINNTRGNKFFGFCNGCNQVMLGGMPTGSKVGAQLFEVRDADKGDVARMIFYMAVRYEGTGGEPDLELTNTLLPEGNEQPLMGLLSDLLVWNQQDPPDAFELHRHEVIFGYQNNRNPFIDFPELAEYLWGTLSGNVWNGTVHTTAARSASAPVLYPNPTDARVSSTMPFETAVVYDLQGREVARYTGSSNINVAGVSPGTYLVQLQLAGGSVHTIRLVARGQ
jgi:endonuclease I